MRYILFLITIFAIGLLGSGVYGIVKYHTNAWDWVSQQYNNLTSNVIAIIDDTPKFVSTAKDNIIDSEIAKSFTDTITEQKARNAEHIAQQQVAEGKRLSRLGVSNPRVVVEEITSNRELRIGLEVVELVNTIRKERGSPELAWDDKLYEYSLAHSNNMAKEGRMFHTDMYLPYGENAWWGGGSSWEAKNIVESWMTSPKHRTWLLCPNLKRIAVGIAYSNNGMYASWTFWRSETRKSDWWYQYTPDNPPEWWY